MTGILVGLSAVYVVLAGITIATFKDLTPEQKEAVMKALTNRYKDF